MSELKATPGPYFCSNEPGDWGLRGCVRILGKDNADICYVEYTTPYCVGASSREIEACAVAKGTAHLLAASWDLYHALEDAEGLVIGWAAHWATDYGGAAVDDAADPTCAFNGWHPVHREIYQNIKAALAKARGEQ